MEALSPATYYYHDDGIPECSECMSGFTTVPLMNAHLLVCANWKAMTTTTDIRPSVVHGHGIMLPSVETSRLARLGEEGIPRKGRQPAKKLAEKKTKDTHVSTKVRYYFSLHSSVCCRY